MRLTRFVLVMGVLGICAFGVVAQVDTPIQSDGAQAIDGTVIGLALLGLVLIGAFVAIARQQAQNLSAERDGELFVSNPDDTKKRLEKVEATTPLDPASDRIQVTRPQGDTRPYLVLTVRNSKDQNLTIGKNWVIKPDDTPFVIGTHDTSDIQIEDVYVSRKHLTITYDDDQETYILIDDRSANGTHWNGDTMIKRRHYRVPTRHEVQIDIVNDHAFSAYIDAFSRPVAEQVAQDLPDQQPLPTTVEAQLTWTSPETEREQTMQLTHVITAIGRGEQADVHINHPLVSEVHAYLVWRDGQFLLVDQSANGTWLFSKLGETNRLEAGKFNPLKSDINCQIEIARDAVQLDFRYTQERLLEQNLSTGITDELPTLPAGVHPLLHIVREGKNEQRREIRVNTSEITIGTAESNFIRFVHDMMADEHAKIVFDSGVFWLYDLSGMGTVANQQRLYGTRMRLEPEQIYDIRIYDQQQDEIQLAFYYERQGDIGDWQSEPSPDDQRLTQKINTRSQD